jgi:hypothetical protein
LLISWSTTQHFRILPKRIVKHCVVSIIIVFFFGLSSPAQDKFIRDSVQQVFTAREQSFNQTQLYLHIDKSIYVNNENLWFKAYILNSPVPLEQQHTLFVSLSERLSKKVLASKKFVIENGISAGDIFLPDSLKEGDYNVIAYTNSLTSEKEPTVFQQMISIRKPPHEAPYTFNFENAKFISTEDSISFVYKIVNSKLMYPKNTDVAYKIIADEKVIASGKKKVGQYGELPISFLPGTADKFELEAIVVEGKDTFMTRQTIPFLDQVVNIRFFPEGGDLVNNVTSKVAVEAIDLSGKPVQLKGQLFEDDIAIATINSNAAGLAIVTIKPSSSKKYSVRLADAASKKLIVHFPVIQKTGYTLSVLKGVAGDTILATINRYGSGTNVHLLVHNYEELFTASDLLIKGNQLKVKIPVTGLKEGLITLTLLDSTGRPCAERTVFTGYHKMPIVTIETDSAEYHKRSKVSLRINVTDQDANPLAGNYSLACVLTRRIDSTSYQDITPYYYFNSHVEHHLIKKPSFYGMRDEQTMELFLLSRCWTRYKEPVVDSAVTAFVKRKALDVSGYVLYFDKKPKKPVTISLILSNGIQEVITDEQGHFTIPASMLAMEADQLASVIVAEKDASNYRVKFDDDVSTLENNLATLGYPLATQMRSELPGEDFIGNNKAITLSNVIVRSKTDNDNFGNVYKSTDCNDWVCLYHILNCRNHPSGTRPVDGETYTYMGRPVVYRGCAPERKEFFLKLKGRYYTKEFYRADYSKFNAPDPELFSTVYWMPEITTDQNGEATISFYTNDLSGLFSIVIEGITVKGPVNSKILLKVLK